MPQEDGATSEVVEETIEQTAETANGTESQEGEAGAGEQTEESTEESGDKPSPEDELPEWARGELKKVRGEAANYRTQLRESQKALTEAKTPEEFEAAVGDLNSKIAELEATILRGSVAAKHKLPAELAAVLKGDTEAELDAHAKVLAKYAPVTETPDPDELDGGLNPGSDPDETSDPRELARLARGKRR